MTRDRISVLCGPAQAFAVGSQRGINITVPPPLAKVSHAQTAFPPTGNTPFLNMHYFLLSILSLATVALSAPAAGVKKSCKDYIIPLEVTTENLIWTWDKLETNTDITLYNSEAGRRDAAEAFKPYALPTTPTTATYNIAGTFCQPSSGGDGTVLLATHGGGFDRS